MSNQSRGLISFLTGIMLASCASLPLPLAVSSGSAPSEIRCVCNSYFEPTHRPAWVDAGDVVTRETYQTTGSSQCSGLQNMDIDKADLSARSKLGRILNTQVSSNISDTRTSYGGGVGSSKASIQSSLLSEGILEDSRITQRWVDPAACRVYARVQIASRQIEASKAKIAKVEAERLGNQTYYIDTQDNKPAHKALVASAAGQLLSIVGITKIVAKPSASAHRIKFSFRVTQYDAGQAIRGELRTQIFAPNQSPIWQHVTPAKGVSFGGASQPALVAKAMVSATRSLAPILQNRLAK